MTTSPHTLRSAAAPITDLDQARFDRAAAELAAADPRARVSLDDQTGLAVGVDVNVPVELPLAARALPGSDRAAAASVLFLDRYAALFGIPGWQALEPQTAAPVGRSTWFSFTAATRRGTVTVNVCADEDVVRHVRVER